MPPTVFIVGVGRSGTTLIYRIVQRLFRRRFGRDYTSSYEPLIWNRELFDREYEDCAHLFGKTSSLSVEGIYVHQQLPMFIEQPGSLADYAWSPLLQHFSREHGPTLPHVAKFIRMNGRLPLLRRLHPDAKIIVLLRNPVDSVNSVKGKFDYYGEDFYPSDFPRFCAERQAQLLLDPSQATWAERSAEYVLQMAMAAIEFTADDRNTLVVDYDQTAQAPGRLVRSLCRFLDFELEEKTLSVAQKRAGPVTPSVTLSEEEYEDASRYLAPYVRATAPYGPDLETLDAALSAKYLGRLTAPPLDTSLEGLTTNRLRALLRRAKG